MSPHYASRNAAFLCFQNLDKKDLDGTWTLLAKKYTIEFMQLAQGACKMLLYYERQFQALCVGFSCVFVRQGTHLYFTGIGTHWNWALSGAISYISIMPKFKSESDRMAIHLLDYFVMPILCFIRLNFWIKRPNKLLLPAYYLLKIYCFLGINML